MKQYRTLNDGEIVMAGDEFWGMDRTWIPSTEIGKKVTSYTHKMYRRPLTETSSQMTDTCPDCSTTPCDCGIPAGYTPTPRTDDVGRYCSHQRRERWIKQPTNTMNNTPTPRTDELGHKCAETSYNPQADCDLLWPFARQLERELTAVTEQRDEARRLAEKYRNLSCQDQDQADATLLPWETNQSIEP